MSFAGDAAWSAFVSANVDDLHRALTEPPEPEPEPVRTLEDMSEREIKSLERRYRCPVKSPCERRKGVL